MNIQRIIELAHAIERCDAERAAAVAELAALAGNAPTPKAAPVEVVVEVVAEPVKRKRANNWTPERRAKQSLLMQAKFRSDTAYRRKLLASFKKAKAARWANHGANGAGDQA